MRRVIGEVTGAQKRFRGFLTAAGSPFNLAVTRMVVFGAILVLCLNQSADLMGFSRLPAGLRFPPSLIGPIIGWIPITPTIVGVAQLALLLAAGLAFIGFRTRIAAWLTVVLGVYVLGIPQFYGKVDHYHHLLWFAAILAVSRCSDVLAIDAFISARRRADGGDTAPPEASPAYGTPLRFIWLLMGLVYFFPGLAKVVSGHGFGWATPENLRALLYTKWFSLGEYAPPLHVDRFSFGLVMMGIGTLVFEMGFLFAILGRRTRFLAAASGLAFHNFTGLFMGIWFWHLQVCYVTFVNWEGVLRRIGTRAWKSSAVLVFDGHCGICRQVIAGLRTIDVFRRIEFVSAMDRAELRQRGIDHLNESALVTEMHLVVDQRIFTGFAAYRRLAARIPGLWPLLAVAYLPPVPALGEKIYRSVADRRQCQLSQDSGLTVTKHFRRGPAGVSVVGGILVMAVWLAGVFSIGTGWPIAMYPSFKRVANVRTVDVIETRALAADGTVLPFSLAQQLSMRIPAHRYEGLMQNILAPGEAVRRDERLEDLWLAAECSGGSKEVVRVEFLRATHPLQPGETAKVVRSELLHTMLVPPNSCGEGTEVEVRGPRNLGDKGR